MITATDPAVFGCVMYYAASIYPVFERVGFEAAQKIVQVAEQASLEYPLFQRDKTGKFPTVDLPEFGPRPTPFCAAVMSAFLVWTQRKAGNPLPDSPLIQAASSGYTLWRLEVGGPSKSMAKKKGKR